MSLRFAIGGATIHRFKVGPSKSVKAEDYFSGAPAALVRDALARYRPPSTDGIVSIGYAGVLVEAGGHRILIDGAGTGDSPAASLRKALAGIGRQPDDVDIVVCTHAHEDRVAGLTEPNNGTLVPVFPHARHLIHAAELAFFRDAWRAAPGERFGRVYESALRPLERAGVLQTADAGAVIAEDGRVSVRLEEAPGHAPGHFVVRIVAGGDSALFASDIFHHPLQTLDPRICTLGDSDSAVALATRKAAAAQCRNERTVVIGGHFLDSGVGRIVVKPGSVAFEPLA